TLIQFQMRGLQTGTATAFALDSVSFLVSAACLFALLRTDSPKDTAVREDKPPAHGSALSAIREGFALVMASPWLWITIAIAGLSNFTLAGPISVALPILVKKHLGADVDTLGMIFSAFSLGSVITAIWLGRQKKIRRRGLLAYLAWIVTGLLMVP